MRSGDFGEVAAAYPAFRLYNPFTGGAGGAGRDLFAEQRRSRRRLINTVSRSVLGYYPLPNTTQDLNSQSARSTTTSSSARSASIATTTT